MVVKKFLGVLYNTVYEDTLPVGVAETIDDKIIVIPILGNKNIGSIIMSYEIHDDILFLVKTHKNNFKRMSYKSACAVTLNKYIELIDKFDKNKIDTIPHIIGSSKNKNFFFDVTTIVKDLTKIVMPSSTKSFKIFNAFKYYPEFDIIYVTHIGLANTVPGTNKGYYAKFKHINKLIFIGYNINTIKTKLKENLFDQFKKENYV